MPVSVKFHTKALQYERGQVVHGLTRSPVLDGLIRRGHAEVLQETPDQSVTPPVEPDPAPPEITAEPETVAEDAPAPESPRRSRKRTDDAD